MVELSCKFTGFWGLDVVCFYCNFSVVMSCSIICHCK